MPVGKKLVGNYPQKFPLWENAPAKLPPTPFQENCYPENYPKKSVLAKSITKVRKKDLVRFSKTFKIRFKFEYLKIA